MFNDLIKKFDSALHERSSYQISDGTIKTSRNSLNKGTTIHEIVITHHTKIKLLCANMTINPRIGEQLSLNEVDHKFATLSTVLKEKKLNKIMGMFYEIKVILYNFNNFEYLFYL